jgi:hypothetical protein
MKSSMVIIIEGQVLSSLIVGSAMFFGFPFARKDINELKEEPDLQL